MERSYTVKEIDALREVCRNKLIWGYYSGVQAFQMRKVGNMTVSSSRSYNETELTKQAEEMVRTFMLSGHTADDLLASEA